MQLWLMDELVTPISARMEFHFAEWMNEKLGLTVKMLSGFLEKKIVSLQGKDIDSRNFDKVASLVDLIVSLDEKMLSHDWLKVWANNRFWDTWRKLKLELKSDKAWIHDDIKEIDLNKDTEASILTQDKTTRLHGIVNLLSKSCRV
ncbi:hypothetical protein MLD38_025320 [Melastoma candidum]|uniref:Uncharacterized protein n=1 Tax=Melastoma candidum TaxID=119954 RepID=A0ACB9NW00_9MYRT|nr:hypothetical protein MLD38_025320 [Melastoma candidum]